jgi:uncharacterized protein YjgD (DUF1641 family)
VPATDLTTDRVADLERKIDALTEQVAFLAEEARIQQMRRTSWDELRADVTPMVDQAFEMAIEEFTDVQEFVQPEDLLRVLKRLLRNLPTIEATLIQLESLSGLVGDLSPLSQQAFGGVLERLEDLEQRGYFGFVQSGLGVVDRVVTSFSEDDVDQLGDNIVLILQTIKEMTQPEVMTMLQRTAVIVREEEGEDLSLLQLLRRMRDPDVKRGLSRVLNVLRAVSASSAAPSPTLAKGVGNTPG